MNQNGLMSKKMEAKRCKVNTYAVRATTLNRYRPYAHNDSATSASIPALVIVSV